MPFIQLIGGHPEPYRAPPPPPIPAPAPVDATSPALPVGSGPGATPREAAEAYRHSAEPGAPGPRRPALMAQDVMTTPVVTLPPTATLGEAWVLVRRRRFRHLPVLSAAGALAGILSDRDLLLAGEGGPDRPVSSAMSTRVLTATPDTPLREIARVFVDERIDCLPILGPAHELAGILTTTDLLRCIVRHGPLDLWA